MVFRSRRSKLGSPARSDGKQRRSDSDADDDASWHWPLAFRGPIEVYDEFIDEVIRLAPGQRDPGKVEGLLIDFRYVSRDREVSRRSLLCWQCWRSDKRIYVRGYCPFREEMRTFRADRMNDVLAMHAGQYVSIDDVHGFFAANAAAPTSEVAALFIDAPEE